MKIRFILNISICLITILPMGNAASNDYIIYSVVQDLPMGEPNEVVKKNYYLNIGQKQGVESGAILDVIRQISRQDPYETKTSYHYKVSIGSLKVIHSEEKSSIAILQKLKTGKEAPLYEIDSFMVGDKVEVDIN